MIVLHAGHSGPASWLPALPLVLAAVAYGVGVSRLTRRGDTWAYGRSLAAVGGLVALAAGLLPPLATHAETFGNHVGQHLLVSALAPLLLALSAPITLALRTLPPVARRVLLRLLHAAPVRVLLSPLVVLTLSVGGLYGFYLTPLYLAASHSAVLHATVHVHMFAAGCLLSVYLVGVDPMPRRDGPAVRLGVLVVAAAAHDVLAKLLYAHTLPLGAGTTAEVQAGARVMYYGGTAAELVLAVALLGGWYAQSGRELRRQQRRDSRLRPVT